MKPPQSFHGAPGLSGYHPQPTPISRTDEVQVGYASATGAHILSQRVSRLYAQQLETVGPRQLAMAAYGPFADNSEKANALWRVTEAAEKIILAANAQELAAMLALLTDGRFYHALSLLLTTVWRRVLRDKALADGGGGLHLRPINKHPYSPPAPPPARASAPPVVAKPTLSLRYDERGPICELSKALRGVLPPLKECDRLLLVVPHERGGQWYLDTNPKPGAGYPRPAGRRASTKPPSALGRDRTGERVQFRVQPISKLHFMRPKPEGSHGRAAANQNVFVPLLRFVLGAEVAGHPGYYLLLREL